MTKYTYELLKDGYKIKRGKKTVMPSDVVRALNMKWGRYARQISPKQNSIILVKKPKQQTESDFAEALQGLADEILLRIGITCVLLGVEELSDFNHMDESDLENIGLIRADRVLALLTDKFDEINVRLEEEE